VIFKGATLLALSSPSKIEAGKDLPARLLIVPWGTNKTNQGPITCNATTLRELLANQLLLKRDRVAIDFQHSTVEGSKWYKGEPAKVAAFASLEVVEGEGIYLTNIEWTAEGKEFAAGGHYPDLSPALVTNKAGEVVLIHSAGLVRQGEIDGVTLFSAESLNTLKSTMNHREILLKLLGLAEDATDEQITSAVETFSAKKPDESTEEVKAMAARIEKLEGTVLSFTAGSEKSTRENLVRRATSEGKVIPLSAEEIEETPIKTLSAIIEKLPATVPLEQRTGQVKEFSSGVSNDPMAEQIRVNLGVSKEAWDKHNKAA
jgi:phage I-like protein